MWRHTNDHKEMAMILELESLKAEVKYIMWNISLMSTLDELKTRMNNIRLEVTQPSWDTSKGD